MESATARSVQRLLEATAGSTGQEFFENLARSTAEVLGARHALVGEKIEERVRSLAYWDGNGFGGPVEYDLAGTPCAGVFTGAACQYPDEVRLLFPDDEMLHALAIRSYYGVPILDHRGEVLGIIAAFGDAPGHVEPELGSILGVFALRAGAELQRMRDERAMRESEQRFRELIMTCNEGVWVVDAAGTTTLVNPQMASMLGYAPAEMMGKAVFDFMDEAGRAITTHNIERRKRGVRERHDFELRHRDGSRVYTWMNTSPLLDARGAYAGALAMVTDVTEQRKLEAQVREAQRLEALGLLAGGIAHDFNNLLVGVLGRADYALGRLEPEHAARPMVAGILEAAERAAELTRQLLAYAGKAPMRTEAIDLHRTVREVASLCLASGTRQVELELALDADRLFVRADPGALTQVVLNLLTNALESDEGRPGSVRVSTRRERVVGQAVLGATGEPLAEGDYAALVVQDDGRGMSEETRKRVFEPFFSTKRGGRGLGLAAVHGIVRTHGGAISVASAAGSGTTFSVLLPLVAAPDEEPRKVELPTPTAVGGRVLLADDEAAVRQLARLCLEQEGLVVDLCADGRSAVERFLATPDAFGVVLLDVTMPELGGAETARRIRAVRPDVPVVFLSGFTDQQTPADLVSQGFVQKPFRVAELLEAVRRALSGVSSERTGR